MGRADEVCPLCGLGQGGVEHLWNWCPAVALAWRSWRRGAGLSLRDAILAGGSDDEERDRLAVFLHQVSFLYCSWVGRVYMRAEEAHRRILKACWAVSGGLAEGEDPSDMEEEHGRWMTASTPGTSWPCGRLGVSGRIAASAPVSRGVSGGFLRLWPP